MFEKITPFQIVVYVSICLDMHSQMLRSLKWLVTWWWNGEIGAAFVRSLLHCRDQCQLRTNSISSQSVKNICQQIGRFTVSKCDCRLELTNPPLHTYCSRYRPTYLQYCTVHHTILLVIHTYSVRYSSVLGALLLLCVAVGGWGFLFLCRHRFLPGAAWLMCW